MADFEYLGPLESDIEYLGPLEEFPPEPEPWYSKAAGVAEAGLNAVSGALSWIPSGIVKAAGLVSGQLPEATEMGEEVQKALTYEPRTETGKTLAGYVAKPFQMLSEGATAAGDWVYEKTGSPFWGAAAKTAVEAIPFIAPPLAVKGFKGLKGKLDYGPISETPPNWLRPVEEMPVEPAKAGEIPPEPMKVAPEEIPPEPITEIPQHGSKTFIDNRIRELGTVEAVNKFYSGNDVVSDYARTMAPKILGTEQSVNVPSPAEIVQPGARLGGPNTPMRENGGYTSITLDDGTALIGGKIHGETYDMAVKAGFPEDKVGAGMAGFTRPDGTTWNLQGKFTKAQKVINLDDLQPGATSGGKPPVTGKKGPEGVIGRINQLGGLNVYDSYNAREMRQFPDMARVMKKSGMKADEMAANLNDEGFNVGSGDDLIEMLKTGQARNVFTPDKQDVMLERQAKRWQREYEQQFEGLSIEELDALAREDKGGIKSLSQNEVISEEGLSESEAAFAAKDVEDFFDSKRIANFKGEAGTGDFAGMSAAETFDLTNPTTEFGTLLPKDKGPGTVGMFEKPVIKPETLEVMVKGGSTGELPKYAKGSAINLERLDTTQDVKQFQNILTSAAEKEIGKRKISREETTKAAEDLAWDDKAFLEAAKKKGGFSAAEIGAMRQINTNGLHDLFKTIQDMPADYSLRTDASRLAVLDKLNNYVEVMKATSQKSSEAGRALNIHKKMIQDNPEFAQDAYRRTVLKEMMDSLGGTEMTDAMIDDLRGVDFKDPKAVREIIQKYHKAGIFDMFLEAYVSAMVSAPTSQGANILGNTLSLMSKIPETTTKEIISGKSPLGSVRAESVGMWQGMKEGIKAAIKAWQTGIPSDMLSKVETQRYNAIPGKTGEIVRIPFRALTAADEFFKSIIYRSELNYRAYDIARNEGLTGNAMAERMLKVINDATDPAFREIHMAARAESLYRTFNMPLGKFGQSLMNFREKHKALRIVAPFMRTPINIAKFALERTPLNFGKILYDYKTGKINATELNTELAKPIVGSMLAAATTMAVLEGNITGAPPKNKRDRDLLYSTGWQPYSLKIGNKYYSYNRLEPIGSIIGMTADFVEAVRDDTSNINEKAGKIIMSFTRNITSKTFTQSVTGILDAISDPERSGGNYMEKLSGSIVPSIVAASARAVDPYIREVETPFEAMQARIPFWSKNLPVKVGAFEMPLERPGSEIGRFLSPVSVSEARPDMELIAGSEIAQRKMERNLTNLQKKTLREVQRELRMMR